MFAVYGISGPLYQGTLEDLGPVPPIARRGYTTPIRRIGEDTARRRLVRYEPSAPASSAAQPAGTDAANPGEQAVHAYQEMLPQSLERGPLFHANQIMRTEVITVQADDDVARAWRLLVEHQIHQAPVLDDARHLVGIVSDRNLLTSLNVDAGEVRDVLRRRVADVMSTPVVAATPTTDIRRIAQVMLERIVAGVPIVSETGSLLGFISRSDILQAIVTDPPLSVWS
jgi:acetoin utilization protein AcuB